MVEFHHMNKTILIIMFLLVSQVFAKNLFKIISVGELDLLIKSSSKDIHIYDANAESTRINVGIIPGAKLIDSITDYDVTLVLPKEKNSSLYFYCANAMCTSSEQAASRAIAAGYTNVSVLKDGIFGWKKAGKQLAKVNRAPQPVGNFSVEPKEVNDLINKNEAVVVDVREEEERYEMIANSLWAPMSKVNDSQFWNEFKGQLPKNKTIIFYCASGIRSKKMAERLMSEGFKSLYFKSVDQWKAAGLPAVKGPAK